MNTKINTLEPQAVWKHFAEICAIPHPSFHEEKIREYIVAFARKNKLDYTVDKANNIIIRKPATKGMEKAKGIILQTHLDMVPQKNSDKKFDFEKDGIEAYIDGDWVTAKGTTLGADNGIGVAAALAVLESKDIKHGYIEGLFTATEESGMNGAFGLRPGLLKGDIMLNLDSETEGELYVGCAGGLDANISLKYTEEATPKNTTGVKIEVKGLKGGHSGLDIILQRANANKLLFRFLRDVAAKGVRLSSVDGGGLRNAIPREATATLAVDDDMLDKFMGLVAAFEEMVVKEFDGIESAISFKAEKTGAPAKVFSKRSQNALIRSVCGCPNGVVKMSTSMPGLVQTSSNLARVVSENGTVKIQCLMRSSSNTEKGNLGGDIKSVYLLAGAKVNLSGAYDGWNPDMSSPILKAMKANYKKMYGREPAVMAIHAGLECGIIGGKYPNLDMISFGPTILSPHSPDEKVNITSVAKFWDYMVYTLENAPNK